MFSSRQKPSWSRKLLDVIWPRSGFRKAWNYRMLRLSRLRVCPHRLSLGFAAGAFASFTPLIGFHFLLAAALALLLRANVLASLAGTVVGNPLTFPLIWLATYKLGTFMTGTTASASTAATMAAPSAWTEIGASLQGALLPMLLGAVPLGLLGAAASYALCYVSLQRIKRRLELRRGLVSDVPA